MDRSAGTEGGGFSVPEPVAYVTASVDAAICSGSTSLDCVDWAERHRIRYSYDAPHESFADLSADKEPSGGAVAARTFQVGEYGALSRALRSTMPLRWRSRPRFDGVAAGERSLAGQKQTVETVANNDDNFLRVSQRRETRTRIRTSHSCQARLCGAHRPGYARTRKLEDRSPSEIDDHLRLLRLENESSPVSSDRPSSSMMRLPNLSTSTLGASSSENQINDTVVSVFA